nr:coat protein VP2 [Bearded dragon parvovirus]
MDFLDFLLGEKYEETAKELGKPINPPPVQQISHADSRRGLVVPGYKYLGPFNGLDKGEPVNAADAAALEHDKAYNELLEAGDNPYIKYNHADAVFQERLQGDTSLGGNAANAVFQFKKRLLEPFGAVEQPQPEKTAEKRKTPEEWLAQEKTPTKQRFQIPAPGQSGSDSPSTSGSGGTAGSSSSASNTMAQGGGGPMADDNQGAEGVGNASGDWHCDTQWLGDHVITKSTRTWVLPSYGNHLYSPINFDGNSGSGTQAAYCGYATPWAYFDFNRFHCHFSPRDWQRLINNHTGIRPVGLKFKLFNIQVKEITEQNSTKTIANNLTSTVQVFADTEHQLPYVLGNATQGTFPPFPAEVFQLPQYGYCTIQGPQGKFTDRSAFYCLEYFPSKMLRTGNNFEFTYKFEKVPFHSGWAQSQSLDRLMNPLIPQYLLADYGTAANGDITYYRPNSTDLSWYFKNWLPGPVERRQQINSEDSTKNYPNLNGNAHTNKYSIQHRQTKMMPGVALSSKYTGADEGTSLLNGVLTFDKIANDNTSIKETNNVNRTIEDEIQGTNPYGNDVPITVAVNTQNKTIAPTVQNSSTYELLPGAVWSNRDIYLQGPIWAKIPDTDGHFHPSPQMGGFGLKNPPPMILIKNTPVPADPPTTFKPTPMNSFINEYSTGQVTVEMLWEVRKEDSKRWNPEVQFTSNFGLSDPTIDGIPFGITKLGNYEEPRPIGSRYLSKHL